MPTGYVPPKTLDLLPNTNVAESLTPSAIDWRNMALNVHSLIGRGTQLVPEFFLPNNQDSHYLVGGVPFGMEIPVFPQTQTTERCWTIQAQTLETSEILTVTIGSAPSQVYSIGNFPSHFQFIESVPTAQLGSSLTVVPVTFSLAANGVTATASVVSIGCFGVPRRYLDYATSLDNPTMNEDTFSSLAPIYHQQGENKDLSVSALAHAVSRSLNIVRRSGIWSFGTPCRKNGIAYGSASLTGSITERSIFNNSNSTTVQARRVFAGEQSFSVDVHALVWAYPALPTTGNLRFTTTTGSLLLTMPLTETPTWWSGSLTMRTDGNDYFGFPDGMAGPETMAVTIFKTGDTSSNFYCSGIFIGERSSSLT